MTNKLPIEDNHEQIMIQRHRKNLRFLETSYPELYVHIKGVALNQIKLNIDRKNKSIDIFQRGIPIYREDAQQFSENEVRIYLQNDLKNQLNKLANETNTYPRAGQYKLPRFFYSHLESILEHTHDRNCPISLSPIKDIPIPTLSIIGIGLGYHIKILIEKLDIYDLAIFENNIELFCASLYTVDWVSIHKTQSTFGKRLTFYIGDQYHPELLQTYLWNHLIKTWPAFPVLPCSYIHNIQIDGSLQPSELNDVFNKVLLNRKTYMCAWGSYDDEINQVNQALNNIRSNKNLLHTIKDQKISELPVCIIGSGPSLDERISSLRKLSKKAFVISCGSAITSLYQHGIKPDLHIELESDILMTIAYLKTIDDTGYLKRIPLLASVQVNPEIMNYFDKATLFIKQESTIGALPLNNIVKLDGGSPTCTNTGVRFAILMGFQQIFLFGVDLGYKEGTSPHARSTAYYNKHADPSLTASDALYARETTAIKGIHSTIIMPKVLQLALFRMENVIREYQNTDFFIFNCSDGVNIKGTTWLNRDEIEDKIQDLAITSLASSEKKGYIINTIFKDQIIPENTKINSIKAETALNKTHHDLSKIHHYIENLFLYSEINSTKAYVGVANEICKYIENQVNDINPICYRLLKSSLQHFCYIGLCHSLKYEFEKKNQSVNGAQGFLIEWQKIILHFLQTIPKHLHDLLLESSYETSESWIKLSIYDQEPNLGDYIYSQELGKNGSAA